MPPYRTDTQVSLLAAAGRYATLANLAAAALVLAVILSAGLAARQMVAPLSAAASISLSPAALPLYTLRSVARMLAALIVSLLFAFVYATWAARSRRAEAILIPLLDTLQSVPVLGYLSVSVALFLALFPHSMLGAELAAIFAIFTAQAWNLAFSLYQSLRTVPGDLDEASRSLRATGWQRFWRLEVPFAMPGLIWNMMMSLSGSWFFVVASEAISVGNARVELPGVGSYVARAIEARDLPALGWSILAMTLAIVLYDQLLFRPLLVWADRFRVEQSAAAQPPRNWLLTLMQRSSLMQLALRPAERAGARLARARLRLPGPMQRHRRLQGWRADLLWYVTLGALIGWLLAHLLHTLLAAITLADVRTVVVDGLLTLLRVLTLTALAALLWVPLGILIGLHPRLTQRLQPIAQFLAAFPANLLFPLVVFLVVRYRLPPELCLSPLMMLGAQWYVLFNVIAGASTLPNDLREAAASLRLRRRRWWWSILLPGTLPYALTGAVTAAGGAWNASIVSELVRWGDTRLITPGLGAYIAQQTEAGRYAQIALGIAVMAALVILTNRLLWRPLYAFAARRTRLD